MLLSFLAAILLLFAGCLDATVMMNKRGDLLLHSLLDGDVVFSSGRGTVYVEHDGERINLLRYLEVAHKVAGQMCWKSVSNPAPEWIPLPDMPDPAWGITAVPLDRYIYVIGGTTGSQTMNTVRRFDTVTFTWTIMAPMNAPRAFPFVHGASDGEHIYVFGGFEYDEVNGDGADVLQVEVYDRSGDYWTTLPVESNMPFSHHRGTSAQIGDLVYFIGGMNGNNVTRFDLRTTLWKEEGVPDIPQQRYNAAATAMDNSIYVIGGHDGSNKTADVAIYRVLQGEWIDFGPFTVGLENIAVATFQGLIAAMGGSSHYGPSNNEVSVMNARMGLWHSSMLDGMNEGRDSFAAAEVDGTIYVFGGKLTQQDGVIVRASGEYIHPCF